MVTTNDESMWSAMWSFKDHGKSWDAVYNREHPPGFRWLHESFGTNWRITEMQAAIGRVQLKRMEDWHRVRTRNALRVADAAGACSGLRVPLPAAHLEHAWYKLYAYVRPESLKAGWDRDRIMAAIKEAGVPCFSGSCSEVYLEKAFDGTGWRPEKRLPVAQLLGDTSLCFLVHPTLTSEELDQTCDAIRAVMAQATR